MFGANVTKKVGCFYSKAVHGEKVTRSALLKRRR